MRNNVILRQLRYIFDLNDAEMIEVFAQADVDVTRSDVSDWLKTEDHNDYAVISDYQFATFLNGFINLKRGKKEGPQHVPEGRLNNNIIFRKLKIALAYKDTDIIAAFAKANMRISKPEISALFRNPKQKQYRECEDQFLRNFLHGLQLTFRPKEAPQSSEEEEE